MKKTILLLLLVSLALSLFSKNHLENEYRSQNIEKILSTPQITYFGWDFRYMIFNDTNFGDPRDIIYKVVPGWVNYYDKKSNIYNKLKKCFKEKQYYYDYRTIQSLIRNVDEEELSNPYKPIINIDSVKSIVLRYPVNGNGLGLIFIGEEVSKSNLTSSFYLTIFDIFTKEVLYSKLYKGQAGGGFGLISYYGWGFLNATAFINSDIGELKKSIKKQQ